MKRFMVLTMLGFAGLIGLASTTAQAKPHFGVSVGFDFFYSSLRPYGEWVDCNFGYAWRPMHVVHGWRPYMYGRWVWTDYGWYWVSYEPFGWATFHYGRWVYDDYYGWIWVPDDQWGPAWVEWRYDDDYIGWAPLPPYATFSVNVGITFTNHWVAPIHYWNFVPCRYFTTTRIVDYVQPLERTRRIFGNTRGIQDIRSVDNRVINRGVDVNFIERRANTRINRVDVVEQNRGERGDRLVRTGGREIVEAYRPRIEGSTRGSDRNRPGVVDINRTPRGERGGVTREAPSAQPETGIRSGGNRNVGRERGKMQEPRSIRERGVDQVRPPEVQRERPQRDNTFERRENDQRQRWQEQRAARDREQQQVQEQRMRERQANQERPRETPRTFERPQRGERTWQQPPTRERQQPRQGGTQSRGGQDGRRRN